VGGTDTIDASGDATDQIIDLSPGSLSGIDADLSQAGHQSFNFVGKSSGNSTGDLSYKTFGNINAAEKSLGFDIDGLDQSEYNGQVTVIFGNNDDDKDADFAFVIYGTPNIDVSDFIL